jgi:hypothetical protein
VTCVTRFVQAVSHGGAMTRPTLIVVHSAETPLAAGYAQSIAVNWFGKAADTSAHFMVDPVETIRMLSDNVVSYAVGPKANGFTLNIEQAGRAAFTREQWATPDGMKQHTRVGTLVRELSDTRGIPLRWATDAQIRDAARGIPGGVCMHDDIHRVLGGTTHTDPGQGYPRDLMWAAATGEEQDMTPEQDAMLRAVHHELTTRLPNRVDGKSGDTILGYAANADAYGFRAQQALADLARRADQLAADIAALRK